MLGSTRTAARQQASRLLAHQDFARGCSMLERDQVTPGWARGEQFDVRTADRKEMKASGVHALRHAEPHLRARNLDAACFAQHSAHEYGRAHGADDMIVAPEPE